MKNAHLETLIAGKVLTNINFIAEIASTHNGNIKRLNKILSNLKRGNADFIKLQIYKNSKLNHETSRFYKNLKKIEISYKNWEKIINNYYNSKRLILEPFDQDSYKFCKKFKSKVLIKISSSEIYNFEIIKDAIKNFKMVFLNISGFKDKDLKTLTNFFKKNKKKIVLLYGFQSFPSKLKDIRFNLIDILNKKKFITGYADHSNTDNKIESYIGTALAISKNVKFIEKHVTLNRHKKPPDFSSSFEINDFENYLNYFKSKFLFNNKIKQSFDEIKYGAEMHKFAVLKKNVKKGKEIKLNDLTFLRTNQTGLTLLDINKNIKKKKKYKKNYLKNEILQ